MFQKKSYQVSPIAVTKSEQLSKALETNLPKVEPVKGLSRFVKISFGFGHVLNDLCATIWFTYFLVFLDYVIQIETTMSGKDCFL